MRMQSSCTVHTCDGCHTPFIQMHGEDLPYGLYMKVFDRHRGSDEYGELYVCRDRCIPAAFAYRYDIWKAKPDNIDSTPQSTSPRRTNDDRNP